MYLKVTEEFLKNLHPKGTYLAVELMQVHQQTGCQDVPAHTKGIITATKGKEWIFVFPHSVLKEKIKSFSDGDLRIVHSSKFKILGRVR